MRSHFEHAVEHQGTSFKECVTPVPAVILHDAMRFGFDPQVKRDKRQPTNPSTYRPFISRPTRKDTLLTVKHEKEESGLLGLGNRRTRTGSTKGSH
jgi:hypothetical protein